MTDGTGTPEGGDEAQGTGATQGGAAETGTRTPDEVTLLRSRAAGLDAKVTELSKAQRAAEARAADAERKLSEYEAGRVSSDEALRAQLEAKNAEVEAARKELALARVESRYPEAFRELGDTAASLPEEKLAAIEARLSGASAQDTEPPTPRGNNSTRTQNGGTSAPKEETSADIIARLRTMPSPWS